MNFSYLVIKLPNVKSVDKKLPELEPRVSHSFDIKIVSRKKLLKVSSSPLPVKFFCFKISFCVWDITNFFRSFKTFLLSIHIMANNLILVISFRFKLNSNLNGAQTNSRIAHVSKGILLMISYWFDFYFSDIVVVCTVSIYIEHLFLQLCLRYYRAGFEG